MVDWLQSAQPNLADSTLNKVATATGFKNRLEDLSTLAESKFAPTFVQDIRIRHNSPAFPIRIKVDLAQEQDGRNGLKDEFLLLVFHVPEPQVLLQL